MPLESRRGWAGEGEGEKYGLVPLRSQPGQVFILTTHLCSAIVVGVGWAHWPSRR